MIKLYFETLDDIRKTKSFKTLAGARKATWDWVGKDADIGSHYGVSADGVVKVTIMQGTTLDELFSDGSPAPYPLTACTTPCPHRWRHASPRRSRTAGPDQYMRGSTVTSPTTSTMARSASFTYEVELGPNEGGERASYIECHRRQFNRPTTRRFHSNAAISLATRDRSSRTKVHRA